MGTLFFLLSLSSPLKADETQYYHHHLFSATVQVYEAATLQWLSMPVVLRHDIYPISSSVPFRRVHHLSPVSHFHSAGSSFCDLAFALYEQIKIEKRGNKIFVLLSIRAYRGCTELLLAGERPEPCSMHCAWPTDQKIECEHRLCPSIAWNDAIAECRIGAGGGSSTAAQRHSTAHSTASRVWPTHSYRFWKFSQGCSSVEAAALRRLQRCRPCT
ncbi:hypothetical protein BX600DRAFT_238351 [Xylariales sp. PMI_506]|nr:hypothetical protein BX600DRAFT_238351 [Xylariales sp. PMI_506]